MYFVRVCQSWYRVSEPCPDDETIRRTCEIDLFIHGANVCVLSHNNIQAVSPLKHIRLGHRCANGTNVHVFVNVRLAV